MGNTPDSDQRFESRMSDTEALMWQIEDDPWLNPSGGVLALFDREIDPGHFRAVIAAAVAQVPRLRERVVDHGRLGNPEWVPDPEFDLDWHVRRLALPAPGTLRQALDLATQLLADPYDRTRPLWQFVIVDGLRDATVGAGGALFWKLHHTLMDGKGAVRLTERFVRLDRSVDAPGDVDLKAVIAADLEARSGHRGELGLDALGTLGAGLAAPLSHLRRLAAESMMIGADPARLADRGSQTAHAASQLRDLLGPSTVPGSTLWRQRSRLRRTELVPLALAEVQRAAVELGGTVNDLFVTGIVDGVCAYHRERGVELERLSFSVVLSTRGDQTVGANAFTPVPIGLELTGSTPRERLEGVKSAIAARLDEVSSGAAPGLDGAALVARMLPKSVIAAVARKQGGALDFATSNLRATTFPIYVSGARMLHSVPLGPVAGTAFNATAVSLDGHFDVGLHFDGGAVTDTEGVRDAIAGSFADLLSGPSVTKAKRRPRATSGPRRPSTGSASSGAGGGS